jgi:hypothetical protein
MLDIFGWVNVAFGLLAAVGGVIVLHGLFHRPLSSRSTVRFLLLSLIASLAGLMPFTRHLAPLQQICIASVYCSATAIAAWLKFKLAGRWRLIFALSVTALLYLDVVFVATWLFRTPPLLTAPVTMPVPGFQVAQILFASAFIVLGIVAAKGCSIKRAGVPPLGQLRQGH